LGHFHGPQVTILHRLTSHTSWPRLAGSARGAVDRWLRATGRLWRLADDRAKIREDSPARRQGHRRWRAYHDRCWTRRQGGADVRIM